MNNPYPTRRQLRAEAAADRLMAEQASTTAAFHSIVRGAIAAIAALDFPLCCPAPGYDVKDVLGTLADWLAPLDAEVLEYIADDRASGAMMEAA
jgi:hypothetical protein